MAQLRETLNTYLAQATSGDDKYSHIDEKEKQSVIEKVATIEKWLDDTSARQAERPKNQDPILLADDMRKKREEIVYFATPILSRPKPKPKVEATKTEGAETPKPGTGTQTPNPEAEMGPTEKEPTNMDVD
jgi:heat shock 70kDa protein 4